MPLIMGLVVVSIARGREAIVETRGLGAIEMRFANNLRKREKGDWRSPVSQALKAGRMPLVVCDDLPLSGLRFCERNCFF